MIEIIVDSKKIPLKNIWYHRKANPNSLNTYEIILELKNENIKSFFKSYIGNENVIDDNTILSIKEKDLKDGSLGLIWHLIQYFENYGSDELNEDTHKPYYIFNTIDSVVKKSDKLIIQGRW